ncbi:MAG: hypothetical protein GX933_07945 [Chloroflexi bacterium]|nr:hypothetical protein [Chloroflexota bacterium]
MTRVRSFRFYDIKFFLEKEIKSYCLCNRIRFTNNQISFVSALMDSFKLVPGESMAITMESPVNYSWCGQIRTSEKNKVAWFTWLVESSKAVNADLAVLLEFLIQEAGLMGMESCAVIIDEGHWLTAPFRQAGFSIIHRQIVLRKIVSGDKKAVDWEPAVLEPFNAVDLFYESQIPAAIKPLGRDWAGGNVFSVKQDNHFRAIAKVTDDRINKLYIEPIFHPGEEDPAGLIHSLAAQLLQAKELEVRVLIPGFQAWLLDAFEMDGFQTECKQQIFIKNLAVAITDDFLVRVAENPVLQPAGSRQFTSIKKQND